MRRVALLVKQIDDELCGAKDYAETALDYKARGETSWASRYRDMSQDELKHASLLHDKVVQDIEELRGSYTPPVEMEEKWASSHRTYIEKVSWIKMMLQM